MANNITPLNIPHGTTAAIPVGGTTRPQPTTIPSGDGQARARREPAAANPGGFAAILDQGLGRVRLPNALELVAALEAAREHAPLADKAVPGLGRLVSAVIEDETRKLSRYLDLRGL
ncbi:hypothetical protein [Paracoccus laeviglucosivorans]|uniref:Uncharacterized protein n=1 Tax=Paracoccus laeviglucosivorans TaxID=1197861 RepID=A0A521BDF3_9RHOB|nr:hypothetical protein [Paracoccus laeviglucosivorans]SMO45116.1 hypothetical protein SAMN06265221_102246 [Paracoccus laeviglucosivorans]